MSLLETIQLYQPKNAQEQYDKLAMIDFINHHDNYLLRENLYCHFTSSAIIFNQSLDKVLFVYHNIYNSWSWVGGHNDGDEDSLHVAIKEAKEETGLTHVKPLSKGIAGIDTIYVMPHVKNGKHISDHLHFNITYLLQANDQEVIKIKPDENSGVKWFPLNDVFSVITEPRMIPIYQKLIQVAKGVQHEYQRIK